MSLVLQTCVGHKQSTVVQSALARSRPKRSLPWVCAHDDALVMHDSLKSPAEYGSRSGRWFATPQNPGGRASLQVVVVAGARLQSGDLHAVTVWKPFGPCAVLRAAALERT